MVATIVRQLTKGLSAEELEAAGFAPYYVDHANAILPQAAEMVEVLIWMILL